MEIISKLPYSEVPDLMGCYWIINCKVKNQLKPVCGLVSGAEVDDVLYSLRPIMSDVFWRREYVFGIDDDGDGDIV